MTILVYMNDIICMKYIRIQTSIGIQDNYDESF